MGIIDWMRKKWGRSASSAEPSIVDPVSTSDTVIPSSAQAAMLSGFAYSTSTSAKQFLDYLDASNITRLKGYSEYKALERRHPMIGRALDMCADYTLHGGEAQDGLTFRVKMPDEEMQQIVDDAFKRIKLRKAAWPIVRSLCQYGDHFEEPVVVTSTGLVRLKPAPREQLYRIEDEYGVLRGFAQMVSSQGKRVDLEAWQIVHWRLVVDRSEKYGQSMLYGAVRAGRELGLVEDSSTMGRLSKGTQRYKWRVRVPKNVSDKEQDEIIESYRRRNTRNIYMNEDGTVGSASNPLRAGEDIYVPSMDGVEAHVQPDVTILQGDKGVGSISDVLHKEDRMFMALPFPRSWYGLHGATTRADADQSALNAIRAVRRIREAFVEGVEQLIQIALVSAGIPWDKAAAVEPSVLFPSITHSDTLMRLMIDKLRLQVAIMTRSADLMSRRDVLIRVMEIPEDEVDDLIQAANDDPASFSPSMTGLMGKQTDGGDAASAGEALTAKDIQAAVEASPVVQETVEGIRELLDAAALEYRRAA